MTKETTLSDSIAEITASMDAVESAAARKQTERDALNTQIEAFLGSGGCINLIGQNVMADPPQKPTSNYGSQPI